MTYHAVPPTPGTVHVYAYDDDGDYNRVDPFALVHDGWRPHVAVWEVARNMEYLLSGDGTKVCEVSL